MASSLKEARSSIVISNYILLEVLTVLAQRTNKNHALSVGRLLKSDKNINVIHIDESLDEDSWQIFQALPGKNISWVDCSTLAVMRYAGIKQLLTFDATDFASLRGQFGFSFFE